MFYRAGGAFLVLVFVFADAGSFLEEDAALFSLVAQDGIDHAALDGSVGAAAHAGVEKQAVDVAQPARHLVEPVLAFAAAEDTAGDGHFAVLHRQDPLVVFYKKGYLGHVERLAVLGAGKDDVLHVRAPQHRDLLLAQDPADRVHHIAFSTAVGPDDRSHARAELKFGLSAKDLNPKMESFRRIMAVPYLIGDIYYLLMCLKG